MNLGEDIGVGMQKKLGFSNSFNPCSGIALKVILGLKASLYLMLLQYFHSLVF